MPGQKVLVDSSDGLKVLVDSSDGIKVLVETGACAGDGCVHCIDFRVNIDVAEGSGPYFVYFIGCGVWADFDNGWWQLDGASSSVTIPFVGDPLGTWHDIKIVFDAVLDTATMSLYFVVDGVKSDTMADDISLYGDADRIRVGSLFPGPGGVAHHSIDQFVLSTNDSENFPTGVVFKFPDPFDFSEGSGVSYDGTTLRVDNDLVETADLIKWFSYSADFPSTPVPPNIPMLCCCHVSELDGISTISLEVHVQTVDSCPDSGCFQISRTLSKTWTRTLVDGIPGPSEFKFYCIDASSDPMPRTRSIRFGAGIEGPDGSTSWGSNLQIEAYTDGMTCCNNDDGNLMPEPLDTTVVDIGVVFGPNAPFSDAICDQAAFTPSVLAAGGTCIPNTSIPEWDSEHEYSIGDKVRHGLGVFVSVADHNIGHEPISSDAWWNHLATQCGEATGTSIPEQIFDLADIAGTHVWSNSWTSAGGVDWEVTWTLTIS